MSAISMETQPLHYQQGRAESYSSPTDEWIRLVLLDALSSSNGQESRQRLRRQRQKLRRRNRASLGSGDRLPLASVPYNSIASQDNALDPLLAPRTTAATQRLYQLYPEVPTATSTATSTKCESPAIVSRQSDIKIPCPVCLEMCQNITSTLCGHVFCAECIETVVTNTQKCPLCNQRLSLNSLHPLYV